MSEMNSLTLNGKTYDCFVDGVARSSVVISSASGESITVPDSSNQPFVGLNLYGRSTQSGTPTPDAPIDIVSSGADGSIGIDVYGKNLLQINKSAAGVPLTNRGITFTRNADDSITINGTASGNAFYNIDYEGGDVKYPTKTKLVASLGGVVDGIVMVVGYFDSNGSTVDNVADVRTWKPSVEFELPASAKRGRSYLMVADGTTLNNVVVYPMIRLAKFTGNTFEPHKTEQHLVVETPKGLMASPVTDKNIATYTDANGKMWRADEIDLERGVRIQRVKEFAFAVADMNNLDAYPGWKGLTELLTCFPSGTNNPVITISNIGDDVCINTANSNYVLYLPNEAYGMTQTQWKEKHPDMVCTFLFPLITPIETPLTDVEIAAYKALQTNKPSTSVLNDSGAFMSMNYIADAKSYIDNKVSGIMAATVE